MTTPLSSHLIPPEAGASEVSRNAFQSRLAGLGKLGGANVSPEQKEKKLREACEGFESICIQKMWQEMRKTVNQGSFLHGREEQFW
ncbi:MAG: peptidase M23, partial [Desulfovibrio sp.]|nr:peptidase M23 [Desulfovibrio sp.]